MLKIQDDGGPGIVMEAMDFVKMSTQERVRFYSLVDALGSTETSHSFKRLVYTPA